MVKAISDWRVANSFVGQAGVSSVETAELDFNIGSREAIEIAAVLGLLILSTITAVTVPAPIQVVQTLHIEDGTIQDVEVSTSEADAFDNDSEVIYEQVMNVDAVIGTDEASEMMQVTPSGLVTFPAPILSPINLTHRVENNSNLTSAARMLIYYRYVELSDAELALQFSRRRR